MKKIYSTKKIYSVSFYYPNGIIPYRTITNCYYEDVKNLRKTAKLLGEHIEVSCDGVIKY